MLAAVMGLPAPSAVKPEQTEAQHRATMQRADRLLRTVEAYRTEQRLHR